MYKLGLLCVILIFCIEHYTDTEVFNMLDVHEIDGSILEGGGQILRMSVAFSVLRGIPIHVRNIRAGRSKPGLRPQHLKGLEIARDICKAKLENAVENSYEVTFKPGKLSPGHYIGDTKTAGSVCLMVQIALPCALFSSGRTTLHLIGGTNADMAPQIDHTITVLSPLLRRFGASFECDIKRRGFFPKGGGEVLVTIDPIKKLKSIDLTDSGKVERIWGVSFVAGNGEFLMKIMNGMATAAENLLKSSVPGVPINIRKVKETPQTAFGFGSGICLFAETSTGCVFGGTALGKRGVHESEVGRNAAKELIDSMETNACVDQYTQDQIIIFMALAEGKSRVKCGPITLHTKTSMYIAELLTKAKFSIEKEGPNTNIIECEGIGLVNDNV